MTPQEALAEGQLAEAIEYQQALVLKQPNDAAARLFLFELLTLAGRLADANQQLRAIQSEDPSWKRTRRDFLRILQAERNRSRGKWTIVQKDVPLHMKCFWKSYKASLREDWEEAVRWIDRAESRSPHLSGHIDGREFDGLRDTDDRFGSVLELFLDRDYIWVPWEQIRSIKLDPIRGVLDHAYRPATVRFRDGLQMRVIVPMLYPGSNLAKGVFATGMETDWLEFSHGVVCGIGAKILMTEQEEFALRECTQIELR